jgi:peptide-methionine (S)-S-oxide reductase
MSSSQTAVFGAGCFWCVEAVFDQLEGVQSVESGYMGGSNPNPTYQQVCEGNTGHVEVVRVTFDPEQISFPELLDVFFTVHDPTTLNRQGNDVGTQYRSVIFYTSDEQREQAQQEIAKLNASKTFSSPVFTAVEPAKDFFIYYANNSSQPYCQFVISPKMKKFQQKYAAKMKA